MYDKAGRESGLKKYIGDRAFYRMLGAVVIPVMLQNALSTFVNLLDNVMVGAVGTEQMSGVSIVNQLLFVFNLCLFGGMGGVGIFTAQYYGRQDREGIRNTFRFKMTLSMVLLLGGLGVFVFAGGDLVSLFLHEGGETGDIALTRMYAGRYMRMMLWGLLPFALQQAYASTLRECGETLLPMKAGIVAILLNLAGNWILIFGRFGMPAMGAEGAALATVISRWTECLIIVVWTHRHAERMPFIRDAYRGLRVPLPLVKQIMLKGMPLLVNELLWSSGTTAVNQCYSTRGLMAVAAMNISSTIANLFNILWISMGTAVSIIVGQQLGAREFDRVRVTVRRLIAFSMALALAAGLVLFAAAPLFPRLYNTTDEVRTLAAQLMRVTACAGMLYAFCHCAYFVLRSGGRTWITFLFDSAYLWALKVPATRFLISDPALPVAAVFALCEAVDILKGVIGYILIKKGVWMRNIVD